MTSVPQIPRTREAFDPYTAEKQAEEGLHPAWMFVMILLSYAYIIGLIVKWCIR